jgi:hypothetical protein
MDRRFFVRLATGFQPAPPPFPKQVGHTLRYDIVPGCKPSLDS